MRKKLLIFSHAVTMAHFTRPLRLLDGLDPELYDIYFATDVSFKKYFAGKPVTFIGIKCIDSKKFNETVINAAPIYDAETFKQHIDEDLQIMSVVQPDLVIGDFRHSLSVSCRIKNKKYVNITNAYWSPDTLLDFPLPEAPVIRTLGEKLSSMLIRPFVPMVLKINFFKMAFLLRKEFRRAGLSFTDYRRVITDGDIAIYCDTETLVPMKSVEPRERFVGPLVWSTPSVLPEWWANLDPRKKRIFLTLGSSGPAQSLPLIITALANLDVEVIVALAGQKLNLLPFKNVHITDFLPIQAACESADLVICNGGSPLTHAALTYGVPVLGIICNNDQLLNMEQLTKRQAGLMLRYWNLTAGKLTEAVSDLLENKVYARNAQTVKTEFAATNAVSTFASIVGEILKTEPKAPAKKTRHIFRAKLDHLDKE